MATLRDMRRHPLTLSFLLAYLIYNDGVQTVISQASVYGSEELGLDQTTLITAVLLVQVLAVVGALGMGRLARIHGAKRTILASLAVWTVILAAGYLLPAGLRSGSSPSRPRSAWCSAGVRRCRARSSRIWCRAARRPSTSPRTR